MHHNVSIQDVALISAAQLSDRYITDRSLPDKAIDLIDEAASRVRLKLAMPPTELRVTKQELGKVQAELNSIPSGSNYDVAAELRDGGGAMDMEVSSCCS